MAFITKKQVKQHELACERLKKDVLLDEDKEFIYENWQESYGRQQIDSGAFFTPTDLACALRLEIKGDKLIDLCAGTGIIAFYKYHLEKSQGHLISVTCVEINPALVEIGKRLLPEANWICGDVGEIYRDLGQFDCAFANPPFGSRLKIPHVPAYRGKRTEYQVIDIASRIAECGVFLVPERLTPFLKHKEEPFLKKGSREYEKFYAQTAVELIPSGEGINPQDYQKDRYRSRYFKNCSVVCFDQSGGNY